MPTYTAVVSPLPSARPTCSRCSAPLASSQAAGWCLGTSRAPHRPRRTPLCATARPSRQAGDAIVLGAVGWIATSPCKPPRRPAALVALRSPGKGGLGCASRPPAAPSALPEVPWGAAGPLTAASGQGLAGEQLPVGLDPPPPSAGMCAQLGLNSRAHQPPAAPHQRIGRLWGHCGGSTRPCRPAPLLAGPCTFPPALPVLAVCAAAYAQALLPPALHHHTQHHLPNDVAATGLFWLVPCDPLLPRTVPAISPSPAAAARARPAGSSSHPGAQWRARAGRPASGQVCGRRCAATRGVGAAAVRVVVRLSAAAAAEAIVPAAAARATATAVPWNAQLRRPGLCCAAFMPRSQPKELKPSCRSWIPSLPAQLLPQPAGHVQPAGCGRDVPALWHRPRDPAVSGLPPALPWGCPGWCGCGNQAPSSVL